MIPSPGIARVRVPKPREMTKEEKTGRDRGSSPGQRWLSETVRALAPVAGQCAGTGLKKQLLTGTVCKL